MKKLSLKPAGGGERRERNALKGGAYSLAVVAVVLAILIAVNVFASALPTGYTRFDISASKLYSITSNTKVVVNGLTEDVTIYWIVQSDQEDEVIRNLLDKYDSLSDHITVVKRNPDVYPTFAQQYTDEEVANNSLVVECGDKSRYIPFTDIYLGEVNMYTGTYSATDFDGEGAITSAIDYVTSDEYPQVYLVEGHGESALPEDFAGQLEKENLETQSLTLLNVDAIPEDAACLMIYAPQSDISQEEKEIEQVDQNLWRISGSCELEQVAEALDMEFPEDVESDTLGGLVFAQLSAIPQDGSQVEVDTCGLHIKVLELTDRRVEWALVSKTAPAPPADGTDE